jgi:catechol-2,3-dioxygenase
MDSHADKARRVLDSKPVAPSMFAHFVLRTSNRPALIDWYCTVLNARLMYENDYIAFITYDDEHHRVAFVQAPGLKKPADDAWGLSHVAYTFRTLGELLSTYRRLKAQGIVPGRVINHGMSASMYYRDPDGNAVELQVDTFPTKQEGAAYMQNRAFMDNPIGVEFDPEKMVADYEAGVPEAELLRRP